MTRAVAGIPLGTLKDPLYDALSHYQALTDGAVAFDVSGAVDLALTPDKPNAARSETAVTHLGEAAGTLCVIAFEPFDGTGDEKTFRLGSTLDPGMFPYDPKIVPRDKSGAHAEVHLALASFWAGEPQKEPALFAGNLSLLGLEAVWGGHVVTKIDELGQLRDTFLQIMHGEQAALPRVTLTTGYDNGERRGDPHAVFNDHRRILQVAAFFAVSPELAERHLPALSSLGASWPLNAQEEARRRLGLSWYCPGDEGPDFAVRTYAELGLGPIRSQELYLVAGDIVTRDVVGRWHGVAAYLLSEQPGRPA